MKKVILGTILAASAIFATPTMAATWTGCYIGANVGYGWSQKGFIDFFEGVVDTSAPSVNLGSHTADGFVGGGQIGCDFQTGAWVFGAQGMFDWADLDGSNPLPPPFLFNSRNAISTKIPWLATLTGRIGYAFHPTLLLYVKGGAAWTRDKFLATPDSGFSPWTANETESGWTIGGGFEWLFSSQWSLFVEYSHLEFGTNTPIFVRNPPPFTAPVDVDQHTETILFGINYRFGDFGIGRPSR